MKVSTLFVIWVRLILQLPQIDTNRLWGDQQLNPNTQQSEQNEASGALRSPGNTRRLHESQKGAADLLIFRSFASSGGLLGPFRRPAELLGELQNLFLALEPTDVAPKERSWKGLGNGVENGAEK